MRFRAEFEAEPGRGSCRGKVAKVGGNAWEGDVALGVAGLGGPVRACWGRKVG